MVPVNLADGKKKLRGAAGFGFAGEGGVRQVDVHAPTAQRRHAIQDVFGAPVFMEAEGGFGEVAREVFLTHGMMDAFEGAFEDGPHTFDAVGMHRSPTVFVGAMVEPGMSIAPGFTVLIGSMIVREEDTALFHILHNLRQEVHATGAVYDRGDGSPSPLPHAEDDGFIHALDRKARAFLPMFVSGPASDIGFVHFHDAGERRRNLPAGFLQSMDQMPRGFLSQTQFLGQLKGRDAFPSDDDLIHGVQPGLHGQWTGLQDRPELD